MILHGIFQAGKAVEFSAIVGSQGRQVFSAGFGHHAGGGGGVFHGGDLQIREFPQIALALCQRLGMGNHLADFLPAHPRQRQKRVIHLHPNGTDDGEIVFHHQIGKSG